VNRAVFEEASGFYWAAVSLVLLPGELALFWGRLTISILARSVLPEEEAASSVRIIPVGVVTTTLADP
jgi:hypothetical protein